MKRNLTIPSLRDNILCKMTARRRIGWTDYSRGSWDYRTAEARAIRIIDRLRGIRAPLSFYL